MINLGRMALLLILGLSIVYVSLLAYLRAGARARLEEDWVMQGRPGVRDDWVAGQLAAAAPRLKLKLAFFVYLLPLGALIVITALTSD